MDELNFAASFRPAEPVSVQDVLARALATPDRAELEQDAAERAAAAARGERDEIRAMLNATRGDPLGNVSRCQAEVAARRDEVADLETQLQAARARLHQAVENLVDWSAQADEVLSVSAQRSHAPDLLSDAKRALAEARVDAMLAKRSQTPGRHPKGRGGLVVRSEHCIHCIEQNVSDEDSYLLHSDPDLAVPVTPPGNPGQAAKAETGRYQAIRVGGREYAYDKDHREITRVAIP